MASNDELAAGHPPGYVPCNGCVECCKNDMVRLTEDDDPEEFRTEPHPIQPGELMLAHKPNGDCVYLSRKRGCRIHHRRPTMCRNMDCRNIYRTITRKQARELGMRKVWERGQELAREESAPPKGTECTTKIHGKT